MTVDVFASATPPDNSLMSFNAPAGFAGTAQLPTASISTHPVTAGTPIEADDSSSSDGVPECFRTPRNPADRYVKLSPDTAKKRLARPPTAPALLVQRQPPHLGDDDAYCCEANSSEKQHHHATHLHLGSSARAKLPSATAPSATTVTMADEHAASSARRSVRPPPPSSSLPHNTTMGLGSSGSQPAVNDHRPPLQDAATNVLAPSAAQHHQHSQRRKLPSPDACHDDDEGGRFRCAVWKYVPRQKQASPAAASATSSLPAGVSAGNKAVATAAAPPHSNNSLIATAADTFNQRLPVELVVHILEYLRISDLAVASLTCRSWFFLADPWCFLEHHGWIPMGPLTKASHVALRCAQADDYVTKELLSCLAHRCRSLTLDMGLHGAGAPLLISPTTTTAAATPPLDDDHSATMAVGTAFVAPPRRSSGGGTADGEDDVQLKALRTLSLNRPSIPELMNCRVALLPACVGLTKLVLTRVSLPIPGTPLLEFFRGDHRLRAGPAMMAATLRTLELNRVGHITSGTLHSVFRAAPQLETIVLEVCGVVHRGSGECGGNAGASSNRTPMRSPGGPAMSSLKLKLSASLNDRGRTVANAVLHSAIGGGGDHRHGAAATGGGGGGGSAGICVSCILLERPCPNHTPSAGTAPGALTNAMGANRFESSSQRTAGGGHHASPFPPARAFTALPQQHHHMFSTPQRLPITPDGHVPGALQTPPTLMSVRIGTPAAAGGATPPCFLPSPPLPVGAPTRLSSHSSTPVVPSQQRHLGLPPCPHGVVPQMGGPLCAMCVAAMVAHMGGGSGASSSPSTAGQHPFASVPLTFRARSAAAAAVHSSNPHQHPQQQQPYRPAPTTAVHHHPFPTFSNTTAAMPLVAPPSMTTAALAAAQQAHQQHAATSATHNSGAAAVSSLESSSASALSQRLAAVITPLPFAANGPTTLSNFFGSPPAQHRAATVTSHQPVATPLLSLPPATRAPRHLPAHSGRSQGDE